jgi:hypothetical protein
VHAVPVRRGHLHRPTCAQISEVTGSPWFPLTQSRQLDYLP